MDVEKLKLSLAIVKTPKIIDKSKGSLFNSWRAHVYTKRGKLAGFPDSWKTFEGFKSDIPDGWEHGKILLRIDPKKPYSKDNCYWGDKGMENFGKLAKLSYNGETKTLCEWCAQYGLNYNGVRQRYFKGKNYTEEQILFGKRVKRDRPATSATEMDNVQQVRSKVSKMLSQYRCKDKRHGREFDIPFDFMMDVVCNKRCVYCGSHENVGLDRIDNSLGHTIDNVVPCCYGCNVTRGNVYTYEEMIELGETIKRIKAKRNHGDTCETNC